LRPPHRAADRIGVRGALGPDLLHRDAVRIVHAVVVRNLLQRPLCGGAPVVPLRGCRHGERSILAEGRPLSTIVVQPKFGVAVVCGLASYAMMNMVMTSAPLAMIRCSHTVSD